MKRELLKQMKNEWRDNIWMLLELVVVGAAIWTIIVTLYANTKALMVPRGFDPEDVYSLTLKFVNNKSPEYIDPGEEGSQHYYSDRDDLIKRLREHPLVESVGMHQNGLPYNYNNFGLAIRVMGSNDSILYSANKRSVTPEMARVLRFESVTGKTTEQLEEIIRRGELLISEQSDYESNGRKVKDMLGKEVIYYGDSSKTYKVGDIIRVVRRNDYELSYGTIIHPIQQSEWVSGIAVRVKPGKGKQFKEAFREDKTLQRQRNVYLSDLKSLEDIGKGNMHSNATMIRMFVILGMFLLVTIFLGLLGTFWFRMQQRVSEIAIRKVSGAKRSQIFRRVMTEGLILLLVAFVIISAIVWPFYSDIRELIYEKWYVMLATEGVAILVIAIGIILSLWYPARRAMNIQPAIAIKDE